MAILQVYGMDNYDTIGEFHTEPLVEWLGNDETAALSTTGGRFGGGRVHWAAGAESQEKSIRLFVPTEPSTLYFGFAYKHIISSSSTDIIRFRADGVQHASLFYNTTSKKVSVVTVPGGTLGSFYVSARTWHWVEIKLIISDTVGEFTVQVDGIEVFTQTGLDTAASASLFVNNIDLVGNDTVDHTWEIDDIVIHTEADFLGDVKIETLRPDADGATNNFTPLAGTNWESVDEAPGPDGDTSYVESSTAGHQDLYTTGNQAGTVDTIYAVAVRANAKKTDAGSRSIRMLTRTVSTTAQGIVDPMLTDYNYHVHVFENDPTTSVAWTQSGVDAMQIGVENV